MCFLILYNKSMTSAKYVVSFYKDLEEHGIRIWIDGGWGVDALLGEVTRPHDDLDVVIQKKDLAWVRNYLMKKSYRDVPRNDTTAWNFVMGNDKDERIDFHVIVFDENGNGIYGPKEKGVWYSSESLTGMGMLIGQAVRCISPEYVVKFHTGYTRDEDDIKDVTAICKKFAIPLPQEYHKSV